jgi:hypothetical protein
MMFTTHGADLEDAMNTTTFYSCSTRDATVSRAVHPMPGPNLVFIHPALPQKSQPLPPSIKVIGKTTILSSSFPSSLLIKINEPNTITAPTQYQILAYCESRTICPIKLSGIVMLRPTVTMRGEVSSIA